MWDEQREDVSDERQERGDFWDDGGQTCGMNKGMRGRENGPVLAAVVDLKLFVDALFLLEGVPVQLRLLLQRHANTLCQVTSYCDAILSSCLFMPVG